MPDLSLIAIPAYYLVIFFPHAYAMSFVAGTKNAKAYNNVNARNDGGAIEKALGPADYQKFQKAKAAHANGHEGFPLFAATVLASKFAGVETDTFALAQLGMRVLYNVLYIRTTDRKKSYIRTALWNVMTFWSMGQIVRAAVAVK